MDNDVQNNHYIVEVFSSINNGGVPRIDIFSGTWKGEVYFFKKRKNVSTKEFLSHLPVDGCIGKLSCI